MGKMVLFPSPQLHECVLRSLPLSSCGDSLQELRLPLSQGLRSLLDCLLVADIEVHDWITVGVDFVGRHAGLPIYALDEPSAVRSHCGDDTLGYSDLLALLTGGIEFLVEIDERAIGLVSPVFQSEALAAKHDIVVADDCDRFDRHVLIEMVVVLRCSTIDLL